MEEIEEQPIIPDPVAVDLSLPANQTGRWIHVSCVVDQVHRIAHQHIPLYHSLTPLLQGI